jgi:hypothetical protein
MISLSDCRKILGDAGRQLSDAELESLRQTLYGLADIAVETFLAGSERAAALPEKEPSG